MGNLEFHEFMQEQIKRILLYKLLESKRLGYDIEEQKAYLEWIEKYAKTFRKEWEKRD